MKPALRKRDKSGRGGGFLMRIRSSSTPLRVFAALVLVMGSVFVAQSATAHVKVSNTSPERGSTVCTTKKNARVAFNGRISAGHLGFSGWPTT